MYNETGGLGNSTVRCNMRKNAFELLPPESAARSVSQREIVVPLQDALVGVDIMESKGMLIRGWEG